MASDHFKHFLQAADGTEGETTGMAAPPMSHLKKHSVIVCGGEPRSSEED